MSFVGGKRNYEPRPHTLRELAARPIFSFQRDSLPFSDLVRRIRQNELDDACVHPLSAIRAMIDLTIHGFGVATLPYDAMAAFEALPELQPLTCDVALADLPLYASWRHNHDAPGLEALVDSAVAFTEELHQRLQARPR
jgi:DNA-binding transcriptional LysR family regulator